jgi:hypothetical protein
MAENQHATMSGYGPEMDATTHEATYSGFTRFVEIATVVVLCHVLALAVGGIRHAWLTAIIGVALSLAAGVVAAMKPSIGYKAPAAVGVLLVLALLLY